MKKLMIDTVKPAYFSIKSPGMRAFYKIYDKFWYLPRNQPVFNVRVNNLVLDIPDGPSFISQFREILVDEIYAFDNISPDPVIIDCGANIGLSVIYFRKRHPDARIYAFEADETIFRFLEKNIGRNDPSTKTVLIGKAVWKDDRGVSFWADGADGGHISNISDERKKVPSLNLKQFLSDFKKIDVLKMDIEGAETDVFPEIRIVLEKVKNIFVEYHSFRNRPQQLSEILSIMEENGFRYYIGSVSDTRIPMKQNNISSPMDLQLNIWGWK